MLSASTNTARGTNHHVAVDVLLRNSFRACTSEPEHPSEVRALTLLADGRVASGCWDNIIRIWDPSTGAEAARLEGHTESVRALAVFADGRLASGSDDATIRLWDVTGLAEIGRLETGIDNQLYDWDGTPTGYRAMLQLLWSCFPMACWRRATSTEQFGSGIRRAPASSAQIRSGAEHVWALALLRDGRLASGSFDKEFGFGIRGLPAEAGHFFGDAGHFTQFVTLPDGRLASNAGNGEICSGTRDRVDKSQRWLATRRLLPSHRVESWCQRLDRQSDFGICHRPAR